MTTPEKTAMWMHITAMILFGVLAVCSIAVTVASLRILDAINKGTPDILAESRDVTIALLKPCKPNHPETCGAIPGINLTLQGINGAVAKTGPVLDSLATIAPHANGTMDALSGTANAVTESLHTLSTGVSSTLSTANSTLDTLNARLADVKQQQDALDKSLADFDVVLNGIPPIEEKVKTDTGLFETTIGTTNHMLFTFDAVETKATHSYLHPPHGTAAIWPTIRPFLLPITQVGGAVAIEVAK